MKVNSLLLFPFLATSVLSIEKNNEGEVASSNENGVSFVVIADMHSMSRFAFQGDNPTVNSEQQFFRLTKIMENIRNNYVNDTEAILLAPGDLVSFGQLSNEEIQEKSGIEDENDAVYFASTESYKKANELYAGFSTLLPSIGDHEFGGNEGFNVDNQKKLFSSIPSYRKGWVDSFMKTANGNNFKFNSNIGSAVSRPIGTDFEGTSYAYRYKNSLFIVVDVFRTIDNGNGAENYIDREKGYGGEGAITCTMDDDHILWFENVLKAARDDVSIKHIFVEAHVPIQHPVRKVNCSGQFLDDQTKSQLWKLMEEYNVDIYFAGEVHATTVTMSKTVGSSLLQIVSRGNKMHGFLSAATTDDTIVVKHFKDVGPGPKFNNRYSESGSLIIDKSNPSDTKISANGDLAILDDSAALIYFDFEAKYKMSERQIEGLSGNKMIPEKIIVGKKKCNKSIHNVGTFGQQYDSQVKEVALVQGRHNNTNAGKFRARSRMAVFSMGPFTAGMVNSISFWIKTSQAKKEMILLYFGPNSDSTEKDTLRFILKNGQLNFRFSRSTTNFRLIQEKMLTDDEWHHIAMSMPFDSCKYSDVDLYIDGAQYEFEQTVGEDNHIFFHTAGRLNIGSYGYAKDSDADDLLSHFVGQMDDIKIWSHALKATDVLQLSCQNNKTFKFSFSNGSKKKCAFLNKNENRRRNYCQDKSVAMNCPKACRLCD